jgi:hypothetical protein
MNYTLTERQVATLREIFAWWRSKAVDLRRGRAKTKTPVPRTRRFRVKTISDNHLVCRTWDGTNEGTTDIKVAKPWLLRYSTAARTGYSYSAWGSDKQTRTSTKAADSSTEAQAVVPLYVANDEIWAVSCDTGVTVSSEKLSLLDLNLDARLWMKA